MPALSLFYPVLQILTYICHHCPKNLAPQPHLPYSCIFMASTLVILSMPFRIVSTSSSSSSPRRSHRLRPAWYTPYTKGSTLSPRQIHPQCQPAPARNVILQLKSIVVVQKVRQTSRQIGGHYAKTKNFFRRKEPGQQPAY